MDETSLIQLEGTVSVVIFRNEENGYTVLRLSMGQTEVTVVGCIPFLSPGEGLQVTGSWMTHPSYGQQFKAETVTRRMPVGEQAVLDYLSSGAIKGIGPAIAKNLVAEFGETVLTILEEEPERLAKVRGMTKKRAKEVGEAFQRQMGMRLLLEFLAAKELSPQLAMPLYRNYGNRALDILRHNPYLLTEESFGVAFSVADQLALSLGVEGEDPQRVEAGLLFELAHNLENGHTFLPRNKLILATAQLLHLDGACLEQGLDALLDRGEIMEEQVAGQEACYLSRLYFDECYVAERIASMCQEELCPPPGLETLLDRIEKEQGLSYALDQRRAVSLAAQRRIMLLTGGPGTGKTTCLRGVLALFDAMGLETALAAPTGRAAKRLGELCGAEAATVHRLLETQFDPGSGQLVFAHDEDEPLKADAVIVDESSMMDLPLMHALLAALKGECRLVLVGDPDQLPSVGPGNLLSDLIRSNRVPMVALTEIFRQAAESGIVQNAHKVNGGELPDLGNRSGDFFFLRRKDGVRTAEAIVDLISRRLPEKMGIPSDQIQVLSPTRRYASGTGNLNRLIQEALNPAQEGRGERRFGERLYREGDRVMQVRNNYDVMWQEAGTGHTGMGMYNGDVGQILRIDREGNVTVDFEGKVVEYTPDMLGELEPAFAVTVHKAQGSEYRAVILAAMDGAPMLMTRGVLYTAITRAKELFVVVGDEGIIGKMTANNRQQRRYSGLRARLAAWGEGG